MQEALWAGWAALVGWGVPHDRAIHYEKQVKGGKFLIIVRSAPAALERARTLLATHAPDHVDLYDPTAP